MYLKQTERNKQTQWERYRKKPANVWGKFKICVAYKYKNKQIKVKPISNWKMDRENK